MVAAPGVAAAAGASRRFMGSASARFALRLTLACEGARPSAAASTARFRPRLDTGACCRSISSSTPLDATSRCPAASSSSFPGGRLRCSRQWKAVNNPLVSRRPFATPSAQNADNTDSSRLPTSLCEPDASDEDVVRRYNEFKEMLDEPDNYYVRDVVVRKKFNLTEADLRELGDNFIEKDSPYDEHDADWRSYPLQDVVNLALKKHGRAALLSHYTNRYLPSLKRERQEGRSKIYGQHRADLREAEAAEEEGSTSGTFSSLAPKKMYWYNAPSTKTTAGRDSVLQGLKTNLGICTAKGMVWLGTGSHVMFADLMHSMADVMNYAYRLAELNRSSLTSDEMHPYGYAPLRYITADRSFVFLGFVGGICPIVSGLHEIMPAFKGAVIPMGEYLAAPAAVFVISACLEGIAARTAYNEILTLYDKELGSRGPGGDPQETTSLSKVRRYLREGRDVMSIATFTESSCGVLASSTGVLGLAASWWLQSGTPDVAASVVMAGMVCGVSRFLLRKSGTALLGETLPEWRVKELIARVEAHEAVVNVYDVKTEMVGTDTVRFKAEVQFNPQTITERILFTLQEERLKSPSSSVLEAAPTMHSISDPLAMSLDPESAKKHAMVTSALRQVLPQLRRGFASQGEAATWLFRNNSLFYEALCWELKDVEKVVRQELRDFRYVHIDLEPW
eukprot:TRINITY_DN40866_c0_g1_i1.p1 TRINITY_DN40866_c0_g1~~TRINITY_DN40866_c0_g1_i1.p1  ORF type:complete len:679 (+),score=111.94 TRINITY_DN40866_c0_g1_i1:56-2092(+)